MSQSQKIVRRAKQIQRTLGERVAAGFLRNRDYEFEHTYIVLFGRLPRVL